SYQGAGIMFLMKHRLSTRWGTYLIPFLLVIICISSCASKSSSRSISVASQIVARASNSWVELSPKPLSVATLIKDIVKDGHYYVSISASRQYASQVNPDTFAVATR